MRNVASRHPQKADDEDEHDVSHRWGSLPAINVADKEQHKSNGEEAVVEDEGLQEVT